MQVTQDIARDFPDISLRAGPNVIAGVLHVPLSAGGRDFIAFLRKGQLRKVTWAGRAAKDVSGKASLEPRASFKAWSEVISSRSRAWTDEQLETAGVLALVYGKVSIGMVHGGRGEMLKVLFSSSTFGGKKNLPSKPLSLPISYCPMPVMKVFLFDLRVIRTSHVSCPQSARLSTTLSSMLPLH